MSTFRRSSSKKLRQSRDSIIYTLCEKKDDLNEMSNSPIDVVNNLIPKHRRYSGDLSIDKRSSFSKRYSSELALRSSFRQSSGQTSEKPKFSKHSNKSPSLSSLSVSISKKEITDYLKSLEKPLTYFYFNYSSRGVHLVISQYLLNDDGDFLWSFVKAYSFYDKKNETFEIKVYEKIHNEKIDYNSGLEKIISEYSESSILDIVTQYNILIKRGIDQIDVKKHILNQFESTLEKLGGVGLWPIKFLYLYYIGNIDKDYYCQILSNVFDVVKYDDVNDYSNNNWIRYPFRYSYHGEDPSNLLLELTNLYPPWRDDIGSIIEEIKKVINK